MWVTSDDYKYFAEKSNILYFNVDLPKVITDFFDEDENLDGITMDKFHSRCLSLSQRLAIACPKNMEFKEYVLMKFPEISLDALNILLTLHNQAHNS